MKTEIKLNTPLRVDEIDFRVQSINRGGYATILAYKDARVDMNRLDAVYGVEGWTNTYEVINGNLFCSISVWSDNMKQWVSKQNVGTESQAEKEKGQASDAFKRAGFCLGIGRELYDYPVISVKLFQNEEAPKNGEWYMEGDRPKQGYGLKLKDWKWFSQFIDGKLKYLAAKDQTGKLRFSYGEYVTEEDKKNLKTA